MRALVRELVDRSLLEEHFAERLRTISQAPWYRLTVRRELFFIDIVIEITSADGAVVIGIEKDQRCRRNGPEREVPGGVEARLSRGNRCSGLPYPYRARTDHSRRRKSRARGRVRLRPGTARDRRDPSRDKR
jgi:hypothetical protein